MNSGKLLTNIFRYIKPLFTQKKFIFLWILVFSYKFVFNSFSADRILKKGFSMVSNGSLDVNVKKFSLLYGFLIEDILISNGENFQNSPVFRAKRVSVQYNLPALFTGSLRLTDISLSSPEIYLHKKGGVWNFDALFEPGEKKRKRKKERNSRRTLRAQVRAESICSGECTSQFLYTRLKVRPQNRRLRISLGSENN